MEPDSIKEMLERMDTLMPEELEVLCRALARISKSLMLTLADVAEGRHDMRPIAEALVEQMRAIVNLTPAQFLHLYREPKTLGEPLQPAASLAAVRDQVAGLKEDAHVDLWLTGQPKRAGFVRVGSIAVQAPEAFHAKYTAQALTNLVWWDDEVTVRVMVPAGQWIGVEVSPKGTELTAPPNGL